MKKHQNFTSICMCMIAIHVYTIFYKESRIVGMSKNSILRNSGDFFMDLIVIKNII